MQDKLMKVAVLAVVVGLLIGGAGGFKYAIMQGSDETTENAARVQTSDYQAVFLATGQLYFGKLSGEGTDHPVLTNVYYLQAGQVQNAQTKLIKLGEEIQGPKDELRLNPSQILYVQDLKDDGQVVKGIKAAVK